MRFLTDDECAAWAAGRGHSVAQPAAGLPHLRLNFPAQPSYLAFCRAIASAIAPWSSCLLWVVEHGIWPSSENWHLYYRVRESYGERRLLHEAPGHLFLDYEGADLVTYLQLTLSSGWEAEVLPEAGARLFVSHDEFVILAHRDEAVLEDWRTSLQRWGGT